MLLGMCVFQVGEHISLGICFPGRGTHITRDMCFPGRETHITRGESGVTTAISQPRFPLNRDVPSILVTDTKIMWAFFQHQILCLLNGGVP